MTHLCLLCSFFVMFVSSPILYAQTQSLDDAFADMVQSMQQMKELMREQMKESFGGKDPFDMDDDFFSSLESFGSGLGLDMRMQMGGTQVQTRANDQGGIDYILTSPRATGVRIQIDDRSLKIVSESKTENHNQHSRQMFQSSSSQMLAIPKGLKVLEPKLIDKSLVISLVPGSEQNLKGKELSYLLPGSAQDSLKNHAKTLKEEKGDSRSSQNPSFENDDAAKRVSPRNNNEKNRVPLKLEELSDQEIL